MMPTDPRDLESLGRQVAESLGTPPASDEAGARRADAAWKRLQTPSRRPAPRPSRWWLGAPLAAAGAVGAAVLVVWWPAEPEGPRSEPQASRASVLPKASPASGERLTWSATSYGTLAPDARGTLASTEREDRIVLTVGRVDVQVDPEERRPRVVLAGPYRVEVVGTVFSVTWSSEDGLWVSVAEGRVRVSGGERREVVLGPGESLRWPAASSPSGDAPEERPPAPDAERARERRRPKEVAETPVRRTTGGGGARSLVAQPDWRQIGRRGKYREAYRLAVAEGIGTMSARLGAQDLRLLADICRLSGHAEDAERVLSALVHRHPDSEPARLGRFRLGLLAIRFERPDDAVEWFEAYLALGGELPLAGEAMARLVELETQRGRPLRARDWARRYLDRYPNGTQAERYRELLDPR